MIFTNGDLRQLETRGMSPNQAKQQLHYLKTGFPVLDVVGPALAKKDVLSIKRQEQDNYIRLWQEYLAEGHQVLKFVPASGAASRMFKALFEYLNSGVENENVKEFLANLHLFAFGDELKGLYGRDVVRKLLETMHYGSLPKGLILFHQYRDGARTAVMEHLVEGALYAASHNPQQDSAPICRVHFTVSHEHLALFRHHIAECLPRFEKKFKVKYDITFSEQLPSTDTLAANPDGSPFRTEDGKLFFRPGGHGALIENLNQQEADIVFIKNIDNVVPDHLKKTTVRWKQVLAGVLVEQQRLVFDRLRDPNLSEEERTKLRRPIRVCGVVKNTGEPGGGPFIVREKDGSTSYQILESGQIADKALMAKSEFFNPVDIVCALRDETGKPYHLPDYVDPMTGFISHKSSNGKDLLALELPGLWNGAMAHWNTIFVEVPVSTFNPVKTVNDLLREQHQ